MKICDFLNYLDNKEIHYIFNGDREQTIEGFCSLNSYKNNCITWIKKKENIPEFCSEIACAIVQDDSIDLKNAIVVENAKEVFFDILHYFWGTEYKRGSIGQGTVISGNVQMDDSVCIGFNCSIIGDITIGEGTIIENNVVIQGKVDIGKNCHIQSLSVIGIDGYGYSQNIETKQKTMIEHFGGVVIGDNVFIGSHVNIARGTIDNTIIKNGVKISPSTHIGHNNNIGDDAAVICSTLYGSVEIGSRSYITDSTVENQMNVGSDTVIGMGSVVTKPIGNNVIAYGVPAVEIRYNNSTL